MVNIIERIKSEKKQLRNDIRDYGRWFRNAKRRKHLLHDLQTDDAFRIQYTDFTNKLARRKFALAILVRVTRREA